MPTLDKNKLDAYRLDSFKLDAFRADAFRLDGSAAGGSGGIDSYVKAMLHFNGANGSTTFTDETGRTWTARPAVLDANDKKFGTAAGFFQASSGYYIDTPDSADFDVGSGDFTVDFWARRSSANAPHFMCGQCATGGSTSTMSISMLFDSDNKPYTYIGSGGSVLSTSAGTTTVTADSIFHHTAFVRYGNIGTMYLDGVAQGVIGLTGVTVNNSSYKFAIGRRGEDNSYYFNGWIDEFRFSKGIARWTADFTPPTMEYAA